MAERKKVPEIRFKGFSGEWNLHRLAEIAEIIGGGTPNTSIPEYWGGNIDWYSPFEIGTTIYVYGSKRKITKSGLSNSSAKILPAHKTILFTSRAGIGNTAILATDGATNQGFQSLIINEGYNVYFTYAMGNKIKDYALRNASGSTFLEISGKALGKMPIQIPDSLKEQSAIGSFFSTLDNLIAQKQQQYDKTVNMKKACLEKMFPQKGAKVPEVRFAGFSGEWVEKELDNLVFRVSAMSDDHGLPRIEYEDIISCLGQLNKDIFEKKSDKKGIYFEARDTLFGKLRPYLKNWLLPDFCGIAVGDFWVFRPNKMNSEFIYTLIQGATFQTVANLSIGTKMPRSDWNIVSRTRFIVPIDIEEQTKIGQYFQQLDNLIALYARELEKLKNIKKACLDKMFV